MSFIGLIPAGGGGGVFRYRGGSTRITYFAEEGVLDLRMSTILLKNPRIYATLTRSDARSDWASEFAAATCCR